MNSIAAIIVTLFLCATVLEVFDSIERMRREEIQSKECIEGWEPPVIPSCDQELWERIKDRCGETDD